MKYFIIILNILLVTLLLYNIITKSNKIIEHLQNCPKDKKESVYKQESKIERLFSEINILNSKASEYENKIKENEKNIIMNKGKMKSSIKDLNDKKDAKMKELDKL